jgi:hypothetical protein
MQIVCITKCSQIVFHQTVEALLNTLVIQLVIQLRIRGYYASIDPAYPAATALFFQEGDSIRLPT